MYGIKTLISKHRRVRTVEPMPSAIIKYNDITAVLSGELEYKVRGKKEILRAGDVIFIPAGKLRERGRTDAPAEYVSLNFTSELPISLPDVIRDALSSEIMIQLTLIDELDKKFYPDAEGMISPIIECLITTFSKNIEKQTLPPLVQKIVDYIHSHLAEKITLKDIGEHTYFSPIYCDSLFKAAMGRSIIDYAIELRIDEAKRQMLINTATLTEIAVSVGFSDYNYFARTFKKRCGYTPKEYKNRFSS